jgi:hypothetical protein
MTTYCAPCLADLALVREAVTSVSGTAACVAHAVLLTHPGDTPQRRLARLSDLRAMAEEKLPNASEEDRPRIELLVQEYALAGAMDMTVPLKDLAGERAPRPPKNRRDRDRNRNRDRDRDRQHGQGQQAERPAAASDAASEAGPEAGCEAPGAAPGDPAERAAETASGSPVEALAPFAEPSAPPATSEEAPQQPREESPAGEQ